jgi:hypothetical protein
MTTDELTVSPVLVRDQGQFREMVYGRVATAADGLNTWMADPRRRWENPRANDARYVELMLDEFERCRDLLGQIGYRKGRS